MRRSPRKQPATPVIEKNDKPFFSHIHDPMAAGHRGMEPFFQRRGIQIGAPGDKYEKEADSVADAVVKDNSRAVLNRKEISQIQRQVADSNLEEEEALQMQADPGQEEEELQMQADPGQEEEELQMQADTEPEEDVQMEREAGDDRQSGPSSGSYSTGRLSNMIHEKSGKGEALPEDTRVEMESAIGADFSDVNIHTDANAGRMNKHLHAQAFTHSKDIYFDTGKYDPHSAAGKHLLAHELTHVVQQTGTSSTPSSMLQRRLIVSGANNADVMEYLNLVGGAAGFILRWLFANPRVRIAGNTAAGPTSESARRNLRQVINDPVQHAELFIGTHQPRTSIGAFPGAGNTVQNIDIDDIRNLNAALPGQGTGKAFHEMMENYHSHGAGGPGFGPSHQVGVEAESDVLEESGIPGRRLRTASARVNIPDFVARLLGLATGPNISYHLNTQEFTHYFLVMLRRVTATPAGNDFEIVNAFRVPKVQVSQRTVDNYVTDSDGLPPGGNAVLNAALGELNADASATLLIEGFTDSVGRSEYNRGLSLRRARTVQAFFVANGINARRIAIVGRGETSFVAPNNTVAGRSRNRRVVLTVHRPSV